MVELRMLIGLPASGKSTYSQRFYGTHVIVSSDALRERMFGDVQDQTHNAEVFNEMARSTRQALKAGFNVIYDATNMNSKKRMNLLKEVTKGLEVHKVCVVFAVPIEICKERNENRERKVPEYVIDRMVKSFQPPHKVEGWDDIQLIHDYAEDGNNKIYDIVVDAYRMSHDNPNHSLSVGGHMLKAYECASGMYANERVASAAIAHDCGKPFCKTFVNKMGETTEVAHYYNHENVGAYLYLCYANWEDTEFEIYVANLIANHMVFFNNEAAKNNVRKKYGEDFWDDLCDLHECDVNAH